MPKDFTVIIPEEGGSWESFARSVEATPGELLVVLPSGWYAPGFADDSAFQAFLNVCKKHSGRLMIATTKRPFAAAARKQGLRVIDRVREIKEFLEGNALQDEALRTLSPHLWQQQLRSRLQSMGLLSLPRLRVWVLIGVSAILLLFVLFRLLPSAEIRVSPRADTIVQTANIFLVQSGAVLDDVPDRVRTLPLIPMVVTVKRSITFDQVGKEFMGTNASLPMTIINKSAELYSLRAGTRLMNQAGMIFRTQEPINLAPNEEVTIKALADDLDLYGEIIGERGNVPANLKWEFPGLAPEERILIYGENREEGKGGTSVYRDVLKEEDLVVAQKQLEQELEAMASQLVDEQRTLHNAQSKDSFLDRLYYEEFTIRTFSGFVLPMEFLGEEVASVPVEGIITYTTFAYDKQRALEMLEAELRDHVGEGKVMVEGSVNLDQLVHHVISYDDDLRWIKLTADLTGKEIYVLDPLTPIGSRFARTVRERVLGATREEAIRILKNLPEVENVEISFWPPWNNTIPTIPSHVSIVPVTDNK
jgi:hypothetical protein